jgi:hypothetical protein
MKRQSIKLLIPMFAGVCLLLASVKTDYDHNANFSQYKTFSWISAKASNDIWAERITQAVDSQLSERGWTRLESGGDATVSAFGRTTVEQTLETYYTGLGMGWRWRGFGGEGEATTTVENTPIGSLTVDVFDGQSKRLVWRGTSSETLSSKPDKNEKKLEKSVEEMFKHFPPSHGS